MSHVPEHGCIKCRMQNNHSSWPLAAVFARCLRSFTDVQSCFLVWSQEYAQVPIAEIEHCPCTVFRLIMRRQDIQYCNLQTSVVDISMMILAVVVIVVVRICQNNSNHSSAAMVVAV